jgi:hypothetical protein
MFPASSKGGGQCMCNAPDVCKTPAPPSPSPVPIPYPNIGMVNMATNTSTKVKFVHMEAVTLKSKIPSSSGDEAGVAGGVVSGGNMQEIQFKKGSSKVKIEGQPCVHQTSPTGQNGSNANTMGCQVAPSQVKVMVAP